VTAHSEKPAHKVGKAAAIDARLKTACGIVGLRGDFNDELAADGKTLRITRAWSDVTCEACRRAQVTGLSPLMIKCLTAFANPRARSYGPDATVRALYIRGLLAFGALTPAGRSYLAKRKRK